MTTFLPQDIAQLTRDAEFALKTYQTFERPVRPNPSRADSAAQIHAIMRAVHPTGETAAVSPLRNPGTSQHITQPAEYSGLGEDRRFRALDALRSGRHAGSRTLRKTTVALFSSSGGCGVTTIAATLARVLSGARESIAVVDDTPHSLLGAYFGLRNFGCGVRTIGQPASTARASVHVVNRPHTVDDDWVGSACNQLEGEFDRMIVDISPAFPQAFLQKVLRDAVAVVPLLPDLRTAFRVEPLLDRLMSLRDECGSALPIYFLLSQFDPNVRLHCEISDWLQEAFSPMVLPLTLRRGDEVSEAMADGETVIDYAPNSGIAHDFHSLATWIKQLPSTGFQE
jgi:cellulose biosynthesis protein BcsQ